MISGLDHIQLAMPPEGEEQARKFFSGLLGMQEEEKPYPLSERGGCWFRSGTAIVHLGVEDPFQPQRKAHPALLVEDVKLLAARLEAEGHPVKWDDALPDRSRFYTTDPFENRIEFLAAGDGFSDR